MIRAALVIQTTCGQAHPLRGAGGAQRSDVEELRHKAKLIKDFEEPEGELRTRTASVFGSAAAPQGCRALRPGGEPEAAHDGGYFEVENALPTTSQEAANTPMVFYKFGENRGIL